MATTRAKGKRHKGKWFTTTRGAKASGRKYKGAEGQRVTRAQGKMGFKGKEAPR